MRPKSAKFELDIFWNYIVPLPKTLIIYNTPHPWLTFRKKVIFTSRNRQFANKNLLLRYVRH